MLCVFSFPRLLNSFHLGMEVVYFLTSVFIFQNKAIMITAYVREVNTHIETYIFPVVITWGWSDGKAGRGFALHVTDLGFTLGISHGPLTSSRGYP